jgi:hypothetical protein
LSCDNREEKRKEDDLGSRHHVARLERCGGMKNTGEMQTYLETAEAILEVIAHEVKHNSPYRQHMVATMQTPAWNASYKQHWGSENNGYLYKQDSV